MTATVTAASRPEEALDERAVGLLLTIAGWTGGGVVSAIFFQASRDTVTTGPFPTARPMDAFIAVAAGSFLVGPLVAVALLARWGQRRLVGTAVFLCVLGLIAVVPLTMVVSEMMVGLGAYVGIVTFVGLWGLALPAAARSLTLRAGGGDGLFDRLWRAAGGARPDGTTTAVAGGAPAPTGASPWQVLAPLEAWPLEPAVGSLLVEQVDGPPVDPSLPPIYLPPEGSGFGLG